MGANGVTVQFTMYVTGLAGGAGPSWGTVTVVVEVPAAVATPRMVIGAGAAPTFETVKLAAVVSVNCGSPDNTTGPTFNTAVPGFETVIVVLVFVPCGVVRLIVLPGAGVEL